MCSSQTCRFLSHYAEYVAHVSYSEITASTPELPPGVGVKLTAPPCCQGCRVNPRGHLNLEGQLSSPTMPSSCITSSPASSFSHRWRLQLRTTYTSAGLKKVQLSLLKSWLLADASINPEGRVAVLQIPASICMC